MEVIVSVEIVRILIKVTYLLGTLVHKRRLIHWKVGIKTHLGLRFKSIPKCIYRKSFITNQLMFVEIYNCIKY